MLDSNQMQRELGAQGIVTYRPPMQGFVVHGMPIITNILPTYHREVNDYLLSRTSSPRDHAQMLKDAMLRYLGTFREADQLAVAKLHNPLAWFAEGGGAVVTSPIMLLQQFGILSSDAFTRFADTRFVRLVGGILGAFASSHRSLPSSLDGASFGVFLLAFFAKDLAA
jgi:hypothetical protein